jgi:TonB family protein
MPCKYLAMFSASILFTTTQLQAAVIPINLKPSSKWEIEYQADSCRLLRKFGEGDQSVILILNRFEPSESFRLTVIGKQMKAIGKQPELSITFGPTEAEQKIPYFVGNFGEDRPALFIQSEIRIAEASKDQIEKNKKTKFNEYFKYEPFGAAREAAVNSVTIDKPLRTPIKLETGSLGPPLAALGKCTDELLTHWGIDAVKHASLKRPALPANNPGEWVTVSDYPIDLLQKGTLGVVDFRLNVNESGKPSACSIQESTREKGFDKVVCDKILKRARFQPALAADGSAIASYFISRVRFDIPQ